MVTTSVVVTIILLVFGLVCFVLSAIWIPAPPNPPLRINLVAAGLAFWISSVLLQVAQQLAR